MAAPTAASPVPRKATPRELVTPFTSERDYGAAANGSRILGNALTDEWNQATPGNAYRCPECPYTAQYYDLLRVHRDVWHHTSDLTEL
ncbi:hypothetical protein AAVH_28344 [Aphelenchoides avenae]|nr:hypothetical protein AAVH_28344 [Aphelenchus avenae]